MGLLSKIGIGPKAVADGVMNVAERAADIVERWAPSDKAKHEMQLSVQTQINEAIKDARGYEPKTVGNDIVSTWVNVFVDALNRLIRPSVAILLVGAVFGLWDLKITTTDPVVLGWTEGVVGFYFGVRAVTQDLPRLIAALKALRSS
jgi:hypothetical protein